MHSLGMLQCPCCSLQPGKQRAAKREKRRKITVKLIIKEKLWKKCIENGIIFIIFLEFLFFVFYYEIGITTCTIRPLCLPFILMNCS